MPYASATQTLAYPAHRSRSTSHIALTDGTSCPVSGLLNDILLGTRLVFERLDNPAPLKAPAQVGVVRQYNRDKKNPMRLYKVHGCKFEELSTVQQLFE